MPDIFKKGSVIKRPNVPPITTDPDIPQGRMSFLTNFRLFPEEINIENQEPDEVIVLFLRPDFSTNIPWITTSIILLLLPLLFISFTAILLSILPALYLFFLVVFYYLVVIGFIIVNFTNWFYNISIVTNQRVIDVDYANITYKHVSATTIQNIKDVSYVQTGFLRSFFDFGDVRVQTEAEIPNFLFDSVPRPTTVVDIVLDLIRGIKND